MAYLQDEVNKWFAKAERENIKIHKIFIPDGGTIAIIYEIEDPDEIQKLREKFDIK